MEQAISGKPVAVAGGPTAGAGSNDGAVVVSVKQRRSTGAEGTKSSNPSQSNANAATAIPAAAKSTTTSATAVAATSPKATNTVVQDSTAVAPSSCTTAVSTENRPKSVGLKPKPPTSPTGVSGGGGGRPNSKMNAARPGSSSSGSSKQAAPGALLSATAAATKNISPTKPRQPQQATPVQKKTIQETQVLVQSYVSNALGFALASAMQNLSTLAITASEVEFATASRLGGEKVSAAPSEGKVSELTEQSVTTAAASTSKSKEASSVLEASLDYSMDFEGSS